MTSLYRHTVRLAYQTPSMRPFLLPLLREARKKDPEQQRLAREVYKAALKTLQGIKPSDLGGKIFWKEGSPPTLAFVVRGLPSELKGKRLALGVDVLGKARHSYFRKREDYPIMGSYIHILPRIPILEASDAYRSLPEDISSRLLGALKQKKSSVLHEITHFLDYVRIGNLGYSRSRGDYEEPGDPAYYNSPVELNAYFQQASQAFQTRFDKAMKDPDWLLQDFFHSTGDELWEKFQEDLDSEAWKKLTPKNRRRFRKRAAQMFLKLKREAAQVLKPIYEEELREALASGDEDVLGWDVPRLRESLQEIRRMGVR